MNSNNFFKALTLMMKSPRSIIIIDRCQAYIFLRYRMCVCVSMNTRVYFKSSNSCNFISNAVSSIVEWNLWWILLFLFCFYFFIFFDLFVWFSITSLYALLLNLWLWTYCGHGHVVLIQTLMSCNDSVRGLLSCLCV